MIHTEHFRKADENYEIRHDDKGNCIHVYYKDGEAIIFPTLENLVRRIYFGEENERFYMNESDLNKLYNSEKYSYFDLKQIAEEINNQPKSNKFARKCSITGEGINAGFVIGDGDFYLKDDLQILDNWIKEKTEYADRNEAYNDDYHYYTEWEDESDFQYEMIDGVLTEIE